MTGLNVEEVNVHVQGVALPDSKKKSEETKEKSEHKAEEKDKNQKKQNSKK